jgi:hypothetical protein
MMEAQLPAVVAHEMFHFWRHTSGRLTQDHWHEEWVANRLAVAYLREHEPRTLESTLELAGRVLGRFHDVLDEPAERVLAECHEHQPERHGYNMPVLTVAVVTLEMIRRLAREAPTWEAVIDELLAPSEKTEDQQEPGRAGIFEDRGSGASKGRQLRCP